MNYKIQFLDNESFDSLPGNEMSDKIGVAYPETGEAFVRKSGSNVVDIFTAMHELEHLDGESLSEHFDPVNHCYYKKGGGDWYNPVGGNFLGLGNDNPIGNVLEAILPFAAGFMAPAVIPGIGAVGGFGSQLGGFLGNTGKSVLGGQSQPQQQMGMQNADINYGVSQSPQFSATQPNVVQSGQVGGIGAGGLPAAGNTVKAIQAQKQNEDMKNKKFGWGY